MFVLTEKAAYAFSVSAVILYLNTLTEKWLHDCMSYCFSKYPITIFLTLVI